MIYLIIGVLTGLFLIAAGCLAVGFCIGRDRAEKIIARERLYTAMQRLEAPSPPLPRSRPFPVDTGPLLLPGRLRALEDDVWRSTVAAAGEADRLYRLGQQRIGEL